MSWDLCAPDIQKKILYHSAKDGNDIQTLLIVNKQFREHIILILKHESEKTLTYAKYIFYNYIDSYKKSVINVIYNVELFGAYIVSLFLSKSNHMKLPISMISMLIAKYNQSTPLKFLTAYKNTIASVRDDSSLFLGQSLSNHNVKNEMLHMFCIDRNTVDYFETATNCKIESVINRTNAFECILASVEGGDDELRNRLCRLISNNNLTHKNLFELMHIYVKMNIPLIEIARHITNATMNRNFLLEMLTVYKHDYEKLRNILNLFFMKNFNPDEKLITMLFGLIPDALNGEEGKMLLDFAFKSIAVHWGKCNNTSVTKWLNTLMHAVIRHKYRLGIWALTRLYGGTEQKPSVLCLTHLLSVFYAADEIVQDFFRIFQIDMFNIEEIMKVYKQITDIDQLICLSHNLHILFNFDIDPNILIERSHYSVINMIQPNSKRRRIFA